jgi:hypothetical protein
MVGGRWEGGGRAVGGWWEGGGRAVEGWLEEMVGGVHQTLERAVCGTYARSTSAGELTNAAIKAPQPSSPMGLLLMLQRHAGEGNKHKRRQ